MTRVSAFLLVALLACGGKSTPPPTAPLPADKPAEVAQTEPKQEEPPAPEPLQPIDLKTPPMEVTVKLVNGGKGKKAPLVLASTAGAKQQVELALDFAAKQDAPAEAGGKQESSVPTIVLTGEAETKAAGADGTEYVMTVSSTDAREVPGGKVPVDKLKEALANMKGLTISGKVAPNGTQSGDTSIHLEKPDEASGEVVQVIQNALPQFPYLPKEPVGVGAKWQATATTTLMGQLPVTHTTDYELVARKGNTWTIKGKTKVSGKEQDMGGSKVSGIQGTGTQEATLTDGALYPQMKTSLETQFTVSAQGQSMTIALKTGGVVTPKP